MDSITGSTTTQAGYYATYTPDAGPDVEGIAYASGDDFLFFPDGASAGWHCDNAHLLLAGRVDIVQAAYPDLKARLDPSNLRPYLFGGNAICTVRNTTTGNRFTYRIQQCENRPDLFFVQLLTGADNTHDYQYLGCIRGHAYAHGRKSRIREETQSAQAFAWFWRHLDRLPAYVEVWHEGRCGRCGRRLTVPDSIASGFGPECSKKRGIAA